MYTHTQPLLCNHPLILADNSASKPGGEGAFFFLDAAFVSFFLASPFFNFFLALQLFNFFYLIFLFNYYSSEACS